MHLASVMTTLWSTSSHSYAIPSASLCSYVAYDEYDNALQVMITHSPLAWEHVQVRAVERRLGVGRRASVVWLGDCGAGRCRLLSRLGERVTKGPKMSTTALHWHHVQSALPPFCPTSSPPPGAVQGRGREGQVRGDAVQGHLLLPGGAPRPAQRPAQGGRADVVARPACILRMAC